MTGDHAVISSDILIIGCPPVFNEELALKLRHGTREVLVAATGFEGMELLHGHGVVLIVLNVGLPDMDARELFTGLRENPRTAAIPVLFLGQRISDSVKNHACRTGSDGDMEGDAPPDLVAAWVASRLRRTHETIRVSRRDPQTGLPNRAAFCENFAESCKTCHARHEPISLAVLSVDEYAPGTEAKANKTKDVIVSRVASVLSACLRATDVVARWSSEEFVVLLAGEDTFGATRAIEKVLAAWRDFVIADCGGGLAGVTVSAGLTVVEPEMPGTTVVTDAERFLYRAKAAGGNRLISSRNYSGGIPKRDAS